jgi:hypothetical protein
MQTRVQIPKLETNFSAAQGRNNKGKMERIKEKKINNE